MFTQIYYKLLKDTTSLNFDLIYGLWSYFLIVHSIL